MNGFATESNSRPSSVEHKSVATALHADLLDGSGLNENADYLARVREVEIGSSARCEFYANHHLSKLLGDGIAHMRYRVREMGQLASEMQLGKHAYIDRTEAHQRVKVLFDSFGAWALGMRLDPAIAAATKLAALPLRKVLSKWPSILEHLLLRAANVRTAYYEHQAAQRLGMPLMQAVEALDIVRADLERAIVDLWRQGELLEGWPPLEFEPLNYTMSGESRGRILHIDRHPISTGWRVRLSYQMPCGGQELQGGADVPDVEHEWLRVGIRQERSRQIAVKSSVRQIGDSWYDEFTLNVRTGVIVWQFSNAGRITAGFLQ